VQGVWRSCKAVETHDGDRKGHTATVFPDEVRRLGNAAEDAFGDSYYWRDIARPMGADVDCEARSGPTSARAWAVRSTAGTPRRLRPR
jgi:hypothetical protein